MGIFSIFRKQKKFFSVQDEARIVEAIRQAEMRTSGEIRVFVESRNPFMDPTDRAAEIFFKLKMQHTEHRNGVLLYLAMDHRELALFADEGIYKQAGAVYWNDAVQSMIARFSGNNITDGIEQCILRIGETLREKFPFDAGTDKNELPDNIIFGK